MGNANDKEGGISIIDITGDTHGEHVRFIKVQEERKWIADDILIICGDFGYLFADDLYEHKFLDKLEKQLFYTICFVDGNHENFLEEILRTLNLNELN